MFVTRLLLLPFQFHHISVINSLVNAVFWSQTATSKNGRGGDRYLPMVFTEHGVLLEKQEKSEKTIEKRKQTQPNRI